MKNIFSIPVLVLSVGLLMLTGGNCQGQAPDWDWAKQTGNVGAQKMVTDAAGNHYVTGYFDDSTKLGTTTFYSRGNEDVFTAKYDLQGNLLWAKHAGGLSHDKSWGITVDSLGNSYIIGWFGEPNGDSLTFDAITLHGQANEDLFLVKYDPAGNVSWARTIGGTFFKIGGYWNEGGITTDGNGYLYITCGFLGRTTLGPDTVNSYSDDHSLLAKFEAATGNAIWAREGGGNIGMGGSSALAYHNSGFLYETGSFVGSATFGGITLSSSSVGNLDIYLAKYDTSGNVVWARNAGGSLGQNYGSGVGTDQAGNCYLTGTFGAINWNVGTITFDSITLTAPGAQDIFLVKYDPSGNALWARQGFGSYAAQAHRLAVDASGNCHITGAFSGSVTLGSDTLTSPGYQGFVAKYDATGNLIWAGKPAGNCSVSDVTLTPNGQAVICGSFISMADFGNTQLYGNGGYIAQLELAAQPSITAVSSALGSTFSISPNPAHSQIHLSYLTKPTRCAIYNLLGQQVFSQVLPVCATEATLSLPSLAPGLYTLQVQSAAGLRSEKLVVE